MVIGFNPFSLVPTFRGVQTFSPWHVPAAPRGCVRMHISTELSSLSGRVACCGIISTELLPLIGAFVSAWALFLQICNAERRL